MHDTSDMPTVMKWLVLCTGNVTPIKRIREQRVGAHLLIYSVYFLNYR